MPGGRGNGYRGEPAFRMPCRPLQHLHAAHRAADDAEELVDAEPVDEPYLGIDHVADRDDGKAEAVRFARLRIDGGRPSRSHASADDIRADDEEAIRVDRLAGPDHRLPPARLARDRMPVGRVLVARERMANQYRVRLVGVELAVGLIGLG